MSDNIDSKASTPATNDAQDSDKNLLLNENPIEDAQNTNIEETKHESDETTENSEYISMPTSTADDQNEANSTSKSYDDIETVHSVPSEIETGDGEPIVDDDMLKDESESAKSSQIDEIPEKSEELPKESLIDDCSASKENIDKSNTLSDDLIFIKPKDKDRGHCYWYTISFYSLWLILSLINLSVHIFILFQR